MNNHKGDDMNLSNTQYTTTLKRARDLVAGGAAGFAYDCTSVGCKETTTGWGLCSEDPAMWPDAEYHLWPDQFTNNGRIAPKYRGEGQVCPFDSRAYKQGSVDLLPQNQLDAVPDYGCFYGCLLFGNSPKNPLLPISREKAVKLYDNLIAVRVIE